MEAAMVNLTPVKAVRKYSLDLLTVVSIISTSVA
jgi:hypothetical protein